ncbi:MAG: hypothetical protein BGO48_12665 [Mucilaginibacter sp. 44-25]|nr:MAG: hypothetical protein BGO48_12665 [Mucilaginibacter sp. 44-25]
MLLMLFPFWGYIGIVTHFTGTMLYLSWVYSIGKTMHSLLPKQMRVNVSFFKLCYIVGIVNLLLLTVLFFFNKLNFDTMGNYLFMLVIPLILIQLYMFSFSARMLQSMIQSELVGLSDSLKAFFSIWFFPLGLWEIQAAVQSVLCKHDTTHKLS